MHPSQYKDFKTSRGYNYHYYVATPQEGKPTLYLAHGFPNTAYSWCNQVKFFQQLGYGLLVPDLLGYGGTDKPTDSKQYRMKLMAADAMEILEHEKVEKIIAIGHDWGSALISRLANYHSKDARFIGFGFLALSYFPPLPEFDIGAFIKMSEAMNGYQTFGYWDFFGEEDAGKTIDKHADSFFSLVYASDPSVMLEHVGGLGALKKWVLADEKTKVATWLTEEERAKHIDPILQGGLTAPLCWYKAFVHQHTPKDDAEIPKEDYPVNKPAFFGAGKQDLICTVTMGKQIHEQACPKTTLAEFNAAHYFPLEAPDDCNAELLKWIKTLEE